MCSTFGEMLLLMRSWNKHTHHSLSWDEANYVFRICSMLLCAFMLLSLSIQWIELDASQEQLAIVALLPKKKKERKGQSGFRGCGMILIIRIPMGAEYLMHPVCSLWHVIPRQCCFQEEAWCVSLTETRLSDWNRALQVDYAVWKHSGDSPHSEL